MAANYYRIARREGASLQPRKRRAKKATAGPRRARAVGDTSAALARARESIAELGAIAKAQERELAALRAQAARLDTIRNALKSF